MQDFLYWLASWKEIAIEEGSELHFEFLSFPRGGLGLLVLLGLIAALLMVILIYRRDGANLTRGKRVVLAGLRATGLGNEAASRAASRRVRREAGLRK